MTKKDFELIAVAINNAKYALEYATLSPEADARALDIVVLALTTQLEKTNAKFDKQRFLTACGLELEAEHRVKMNYSDYLNHLKEKEAKRFKS